MTPQKDNFLASLTSLWLRFSTVAIVALFFALALVVPRGLAGATLYLSTAEIVFEIAMYATFAAVIGVVLGAVCTAAVAPFLFYYPSSRDRIVETGARTAVALAAFVDLTMGLMVLLEWIPVWGKQKAAILAFYLIAFVLVLLIPRRRRQLVTSLDDYLGDTATRRTVIGTGIAAAALVVAEAAMGKAASAAVIPRRAARPSGPNILMVTFDALSAEDMSLYGYRLPTTPNIDAFARKSSVFTNYYSASTFTTPSVATMLTGLAPSEHHVYKVHGNLHGPSTVRTLPRVMRGAGYATGASISNPNAYFLAAGVGGDYDSLPNPAYRTGGFMDLWDATRLLHQRQPFGSRMLEFTVLEQLWDYLPAHLEEASPRLFGRTRSDFPPAESFAQARQVLDRMPDGFFLWVHLYAPHSPYLASAPNLGRFLPSNAMRLGKDQIFLGTVYPPEKQAQVDQARLRYDEFIADVDGCFGGFLSGLEGAGRLRNTAVIVSADHGESFEGGLYRHYARYQTRPEIRIPLIVHLPGQEQASRVEFTADQTSLAPTILEIAGVPRGDWMHGQSLLPWLNRNGEGADQGLAFTQYLATDSIFEPITRGTVGVIDGRHQYVLDLDTGKGILRGLAEAQSRTLDRSAENPALAQTFRDAIYARFPELPRKPA